MRFRIFSIFILIGSTFSFASQIPKSIEHQIHHQLDVKANVSAHTLQVEDVLSFRKSVLNKEAANEVFFLLHASAKPQTYNAKLERLPLDFDHGFSPAPRQEVPFFRWKLTLPKGVFTAKIKYQVRIHQLPATNPNTPGFIDEKAVFLSPRALWIPTFDEVLLSANLQVKGLPKGWSFLAEGERQTDGSMRLHTASDALHLLAGEWVKSEIIVDNVKVQLFLNQKDEELSRKIFSSSSRALRTYQKLLGDFPYPQFTIVQSSWESGLGMAGFTLFGPHLLRYSFIRNQSLPHEILHNYFGNGVFVKGANWSEGITTYLADHFQAEQQGEGPAYRRHLLQKFSTAVTPKSDFPIRLFKSRMGRNSDASSAIGYGKWAMVLHHFRIRVGDDVFKQVLRSFTGQYLFKRASFEDFITTASTVTGHDVHSYFTPWLEQKGLPKLRWDEASVKEQTQKEQKNNTHYLLKLVMRQTQKEKVFPISVPLVITFADDTQEKHFFEFSLKKKMSQSFSLKKKPIRLHIDPEFDVPRVLLPLESPPTLGNALTAKSFLFILPSKSSKIVQEHYRQLALSICKDSSSEKKSEKCSFVLDDQQFSLDPNRSIFIFGYNNRMRGMAAQIPLPYSFNDDALHIARERFAHSQNDLVLVLRHPNHASSTLTFIGLSNLYQKDLASVRHIKTFAKKLPHYQKYSLLSFRSDNVKNRLKEVWPAQKSPWQIEFSTQKPTKKTLSSTQKLQPYTPAYSTEHMTRDWIHFQELLDVNAPIPPNANVLYLSLREKLSSFKKIIFEKNASTPELNFKILGVNTALPSIKIHLDATATSATLLLQWMRILQKQNPLLRTLIFQVSTPIKKRSTERYSEKEFAQILFNSQKSPLLEVIGPKNRLQKSKEETALAVGSSLKTLLAPSHSTLNETLFAAAAYAAEISVILANLSEQQVMDENANLKPPLKRAFIGLVPDYKYKGEGILVHGVAKNSPAGKSGLKAQDILLAVDGRKLRSLRQYSFLLYRLKPSSIHELEVLRDGKPLLLSLKINGASSIEKP